MSGGSPHPAAVPGRFAGSRALVTGGGRGLGKAIALALAAEGAAVAAWSRTRADVDAVAGEIAANGGTSLAISADVRRAEDVERGVDRVLSTFGGLDVLINCAGIFRMSPSRDTRREEVSDLLDTNVEGTFAMCQACGRHMLAAGSGKIVNFASLLSFTAFPQRAAYAASKGAVLQLTRVLGVEWAGEGVNVNAVAPGMIRVETPHVLATGDDSLHRSFARRTPAGRVGEPRDVVGPTLFLASREADYVVGQVLVVDGGWLSYGYL